MGMTQFNDLISLLLYIFYYQKVRVQPIQLQKKGVQTKLCSNYECIQEKMRFN